MEPSYETFFTEQLDKSLQGLDNVEVLRSFYQLASQAVAVVAFLIEIQSTLAQLETREKHPHHTKKLQNYYKFLFSEVKPEFRNVQSGLLELSFYTNLLIGLSLALPCIQALNEQILASLQRFDQKLKTYIETDDRFFQERFLQAFNKDARNKWEHGRLSVPRPRVLLIQRL
jgi:hypothetical protein